MILVAGGTGALGSTLVRRLRARHAPVRVLTRVPARASHLPADVEVATGDLRDTDSLARAIAGVTLVVAAAHGFGNDDSVSPATVDRQGNRNLIDAAARAGADVVLMSGVQAAASSRMELFRAKHDAEEYLRASVAPWTIVRATAFVETWAAIMGPPLKAQGRTIVFGRGENPINFVSIVDVAALVDQVIADPTLRGQVLEIGGPANVTFNRFAALVGVSVGQPDRARHVPRVILGAMGAVLGPFKPSLARHARAAVLMDQDDMTFDSTAIRLRFPELPTTDVATALQEFFRRVEGV
ncbi:MAG: SDR family oxidoreductase [bacterium]